jgi:hypothetical protein
MIILETAVQDDKIVQIFDLESLLMGQCRQNKEIYMVAKMSRSIDLRRVNICGYIDEEQSYRDWHLRYHINLFILTTLSDGGG